ncbi:MAG: hypothetical protein AAF564_22235 [Bacteroidota bacterium]
MGKSSLEAYYESTGIAGEYMPPPEIFNRNCEKCKSPFNGKSWQKLCRDCWKEQRSTTTPANESKHYALVAERENQKSFEPAQVKDPERVQSMLTECLAGLDEQCQKDMGVNQ